MIKAKNLLKWREFVNKHRRKKTFKIKRKRIIKMFKDDMINNPLRMGWRVYYNVIDYDDKCEAIYQMLGKIFTKKKGYDVLVKGMDEDGDCNVYIHIGKIEDPDKIYNTDYYHHHIEDFT